MKNNNKAIMCAAISGILMGASVAHSSPANPEMEKCGDMNACKGTGGCNADMMCKDENSCKGGNECKAVMKKVDSDEADDEATVDEE